MDGDANSGAATPDEWGSAVASGDATKLAELVLVWSGSKPERALSVLRDCVSLLEKEVAFSAPAFPGVPSPPTSPGGYLAQRLGLAGGKRFKKLTSGCEIQWLLRDRDGRDNYPKIAANVLRRDILLLAPAAKCFIKDAVKNTAAWDLLKQKDYLALQEGLRTGSNRFWDGTAAVVAPVALLPLPPSATGRNDSVTAVPLATGFSGARRLHVLLASTQRLATPSACPSCGGATTCSVCNRGAERGSRTGSTGLATGLTTERATSTVAVRPAGATDSGVPSGDVATTVAAQVAAQDASRSGGSRPSKGGGVCRAQPRAASVLDQRGRGAALSAAPGPPGYGGAVPARLPSPTLRVPSAAFWPAARAAAPTEAARDVGDRIDAVRQATVDARGRVVGAPAAMAAAVAGGASESERHTRPEQVLRAKRPATVAPSEKQKRPREEAGVGRGTGAAAPAASAFGGPEETPPQLEITETMVPVARPPGARRSAEEKKRYQAEQKRKQRAKAKKLKDAREGQGGMQ